MKWPFRKPAVNGTGAKPADGEREADMSGAAAEKLEAKSFQLDLGSGERVRVLWPRLKGDKPEAPKQERTSPRVTVKNFQDSLALERKSRSAKAAKDGR